MTAVDDLAELLAPAGAALVGLALIRPAARAYVAWFNRHLIPSATAGVRAPRRGRVSLSPASPAGEDPAVETVSPNAVSTARGAQQ